MFLHSTRPAHATPQTGIMRPAAHAMQARADQSPTVQRLGSLSARAAPIAQNSPAGVIQRYDITYGARTNDCGTDMHVLINGKNDPDIKKGSKPSVKPNWWPVKGSAADTWLTGHVVQGHLLNMELGGPGNTMDNLTPITRSTNTTHFTNIEKAVKNEVLTNDNTVEYRVRASYGGMTAADLGAPAHIAPYAGNFPTEIGCDYDVFNTATGAKISGMPGEKLVKNEDASHKGSY